jgi:hypothetical protein
MRTGASVLPCFAYRGISPTMLRIPGHQSYHASHPGASVLPYKYYTNRCVWLFIMYFTFVLHIGHIISDSFSFCTFSQSPLQASLAPDFVVESLCDSDHFSKHSFPKQWPHEVLTLSVLWWWSQQILQHSSNNSFDRVTSGRSGTNIPMHFSSCLNIYHFSYGSVLLHFSMASSHAVTFSIHTPCSSSILVVVHVDGFDCIMYFNFIYHTLASQARVSKRSLQPWTATPRNRRRRFQWTQSYPASQPGASYIFIYVSSVYEWDSNAWPTPYMLLFSFIFLQKFSQAK